MPGAVIDVVVSLYRSFLWDSGKPLVAWQDLTLPRTGGGLGLRDMRTWNSALLSRALWNIHAKKDSLWCRWIHYRYIKQGSVWDLQVTKDHSPLIRKVLQIRDLIVQRECTVDGAIRVIEDWHRTGHMTARAYEYLRRRVPRVAWASVVWTSYTPPKYSCVVWLALRTRLQTTDRLLFMDLDPQCQLCSCSMESTQHLFFSCPFSEAV